MFSYWTYNGKLKTLQFKNMKTHAKQAPFKTSKYCEFINNILKWNLIFKKSNANIYVASETFLKGMQYFISS